MDFKTIKRIFEKKNANIPTAISPKSQIFGYEFGLNNNLDWLHTSTAWRYYKTVAPVNDAIREIATQFRSIERVLKNGNGDVLKKGEKNPAAKVLKLLSRPNREKSGLEFFEEIAITQYAIGELFVVISASNKDTEPWELILVDPAYISIQEASDGKPYSYISTQLNMQKTFIRYVDTKADRIRYLTKDEKFEIVQIKDFNPKSCSNSLRGLSRLAPIYYEIEQYLNSSIHNNSLLKNGARPSLVVSFDTPTGLTDDQFERIKAQLRNRSQGAKNAGEVLILDLDGKTQVTEASINPKDMDFINLKKDVREQIYQSFNIPKPFTSDKSTQNANYTIAPLLFYDTTILPFADFIYNALTDFLMPRYKGGEDWKIIYIEKDIPALQVRFNEEIKRKAETGIYTIDELREEEGKDKITGGDVIYHSNTLVPIGSQIVEPAKPEKEEGKARFIKNMEKCGKFSQEEIKSAWEEFGNYE